MPATSCHSRPTFAPSFPPDFCPRHSRLTFISVIPAKAGIQRAAGASTAAALQGGRRERGRLARRAALGQGSPSPIKGL